MANTQISTVTIPKEVQCFGPYEPSQPIRLMAHTYHSRYDPTIEPGMLVCLIPEKKFSGYYWSHKSGIPCGIYNHPALILDVDGNNVKILVVSSRSLKDRKPAVQMQHLPIYPQAPHPILGEQLILSGGPKGDQMDICSYVKVHQVYDLPRRILLPNVDKKSRNELRLSSESFEYVKLAVARYRRDNLRRTSRPFPNFPEVVNFADDGKHTPPIVRQADPNGSDPSQVAPDQSQDNKPSSEQCTAPEPQSQQTSGVCEASLGGTGGGEVQELREDGPSASSDQRPENPEPARDDGPSEPSDQRPENPEPARQDGPSESSDQRPGNPEPARDDDGDVLQKPPDVRRYIPPHRMPADQRPTWTTKRRRSPEAVERPSRQAWRREVR